MKRWIVAAVLGMGVVFAPLSFGAATTSLPSCTTAQLVPNVAELAVDQGLPQGGASYTRLARGKETLVRAYLTTPSGCALTRSESITPTNPATLTMTIGTTTTTFANVDPLSGTVPSAQQVSAASDPYFDIPATALTPATNGAEFTASFSVSIPYRAANGTAVSNGTATATKSVAFDRPVNAIRVLVVPMGDPTSTAVQFSSSANAAVQQQMAAIDRVFPVETGTGALAGGSGGVRYTINGGLLDVASLGLLAPDANGNRKFCSNASNYATSLVTSGAFAGLTLKGQLQQALADYNRVNTGAPADVVLGAVDQNVSYQSLSTSPLCNAAAGFSAGPPDDGRASTPAAGVLGQPAWARITYTTGVPSPVVMEVAHNFGISRCCASFHSSNVAGDVTAANHAMNVLQKKVLFTGGTLGASHSAMNYNTTSVPYTADNVVLEPNDWADMLCDLGGIPLTNGCALGSSAGTSTGVAASFSINGTTDGTDARVTNSYATSIDGGLQTQGDPASTTRLILSNGGSCSSPGTTLLDFGLPVTSDEGHGPAGSGDDGGPSAFHALVPMPSSPTTVQVKVNGTVKYCRAPTTTPDVTSTAMQPADLGQLLTSFAMPGGGVNGRAIAYDSDTKTLYGTFADNTNLVQFSTSGSLIRTVGIGKSVGSLSYDPTSKQLYGGQLTSGGGPDDGSVYEISTGVTPAITSTLNKFDFSGDATCRGGTPGAIDGLAYFPSTNSFAASGDAAQVAHLITLDGEFWSLGAPFSVAAFNSDCNSGIARDGNGGAWYALLNTSGDTTTFVHRVTPNGTADLSFQTSGFEAEDIDYDPVTFAPQCVLWANEATGGTPQIRAYSVPCSGAQPSGQKVVSFSATGDDLVGTAYVTCGGTSPKYPVADSLSPVATDEALSTFSFAFTPTLSCAGGNAAQLITSVSDGINVTGLGDPQATTTIPSDQKDPVATINAPTPGQNYAVGAKVTLNGSGFDYTDGALSGSQLAWTIDGNSKGTGATPPDVPATPGDHTVTLTVTDQVGKSGSASVTIHVDGTAPVLTLAPGTSGGVESIVASDNAPGDSGLANVFCSANSSFAPLTPGFAAGPTYSGSFSYSAATIQQLSCTAYDKAGNQTTVNTLTQYAPAGQACGGSPGKTALQPVNPDGSSVFKKGSAVPVKFAICDGTGPVGPSAVVDRARAQPPAVPDALGGGLCTATPTSTAGTPVLCSVSTGAGSIDESVYSNTPDTAFRFSSPQWVFNLATDNLTAGRTYIYYVPLNDDTNIFFKFALK